MMLRYLLNLVLFVGLTVPLAEGFSRIDRMPSILREKFDYYREHHDEIDTIVVGSSNMYYGFDPEAFDAAMQAKGVPSRTLNLGYPGMMGHEIDEMIRVALRLDMNRQLRRVYIDVRPFSAIENSIYRGTEYEVWWHSPYQTAAVIRTLALSDLSSRRKIRLTFMHLRLFMQNLLPIGLVSNLHRQRELADKNAFIRAVVERTRGYERLSIETDLPFIANDGRIARRGMHLGRIQMLENPEPYLMEVEALKLRANAVGSLKRENLAAWQAQISRLRDRGIAPIHVMMPAPGNGSSSTGNALAVAGIFPNYVSFNDPAKFPLLFKTELRYEPSHLNAHGAELLSSFLAEHAVELPNSGEADSGVQVSADAQGGRNE